MQFVLDATEKSPLVDNAEKKKGETDASNDIDMDGGPSRAEGQLRFEVQNFSKIKDTVYSDPVMIRNLQW